MKRLALAWLRVLCERMRSKDMSTLEVGGLYSGSGGPHLVAAGEQEVENGGVLVTQKVLAKFLVLLVKLQPPKTC